MKTYQLTNPVDPVTKRVARVVLTRYGKEVWSRAVTTDAQIVNATWSARTEAGRLGGTHVIFNGHREELDPLCQLGGPANGNF